MSSLSILSLALAVTTSAQVAIVYPATATPKTPTYLAQNDPQPVPRSREGRARRADNLLDQLNLTDTQKRQIAAIRQKYQGQMNQLRENLRSDRQELETLMAGNATDEKIRSKHQEVERNRQKLSDLRFKSLLEMRQVLNPDQRSKFARLMQERRPGADDR
jgi:Spy/CpxP family protein refolding chaperone